jgi:hypothetical protein
LKDEQNELQTAVQSHTDSITMINNKVAELQGKTPQRYSLLQMIFAIVVTVLIAAVPAALFIGSLYQKVNGLEKKVDEIKPQSKGIDTSTVTPQLHSKEKDKTILGSTNKVVKH